MTFRRLTAVMLTGAAAMTLAGCDDYYGSGYGWGSGYYGDYGYYGSQPYYGWYDDYYYPGSGVYIYDRYGSRRTWDGHHRNYWEGRRHRHRRHH
jgi:hypothetical protein